MSPLFWLPEDLKFSDATGRTKTLLGDPKSEGLYVTRTLIPKGTEPVPHTHSNSRTVTVISGTCYYGHGEEFAASRTIPLPPGSFFTEPAGIPHFIWAKDGDVIIQTAAMGPSGTKIIPDKKPGAVQGRP
jgi:quercetin dioxygenase-like cupin family protein